MRVLAKNKQGKLVHADQAHKYEIYYDEQGNKLIVKQNKYHRFFAKKINSHYNGLSESLEHQIGKQIMAKFYKNVQFEYAINRKQRADLFIFPNKVVEIQCSILSYNKLLTRHRCYQQLGYDDLWILSIDYWYKRRQMLMFLRYDNKFKFHVYYFCPKKRKLYLEWRIGNCLAKGNICEITEDSIALCQNKYYCSTDNNQNELKKQFQYGSVWQRKFKELWYMKRLDINDYLDLLAQPIDFPFMNYYDEWILKSQYLWTKLGVEYIDQYKHKFVFISRHQYISSFTNMYSLQLEKTAENNKI